jgi:SAM-dependent methyltransferase
MSTATYPACPVCSAPAKLWRTKQEKADTYRIERCEQCAYGFVNPRPSAEFLTEFYSQVGHGERNREMTAESVLAQEERYPNSTLDAKRMLSVVKQLTGNRKSSLFLDVGCGYGIYSREARRAGFDVVALEPAAVERRIASDLAGTSPRAISFEEADGGPYAVILMSHILEHALDVNVWIAKAWGLLEPGGILAIALPNFDSLFRKVMQERDPYVCPPAHLNYFNARNLSRLLARHGFEVAHTEWVSRLPVSTFEKRLKFLGPATPIALRLGDVVLQGMDRARHGMTLHIYARKVNAAAQ